MEDIFASGVNAYNTCYDIFVNINKGKGRVYVGKNSICNGHNRAII